MRKRNDTLLALVVVFLIFEYYYYTESHNQLPGVEVEYDNSKVTKVEKQLPDMNTSSACEQLKNISLQEFFRVVPVSPDNVFMLWLNTPPSLLFRTLCSGESWAYNHPNASVWFTFTVRELKDQSGLLKQLMERYPNIRFIYADLEYLFEETPLEELGRQKAWEKSKWPEAHLSDFMRNAMIWHKGGYYTDTDVYIVKPFSKFRNFISTGSLSANPMLFHNEAHNPWMKEFMRTQASDYKPGTYAWNGPGAGRRTAERLCGTDFAKKRNKDGTVSDCSFNGTTLHFVGTDVCPHPVENFLKPKQTVQYEKLLAGAVHAFHSTNVHTKDIHDTFTSGSLMQNAAMRNCPFIYSKAQQNSKFW